MRPITNWDLTGWIIGTSCWQSAVVRW